MAVKIRLYIKTLPRKKFIYDFLARWTVIAREVKKGFKYIITVQ